MLFKWLPSFLISNVLTRLIISLSNRFKYFQPVSSTISHAHKKNTPSLGGIAIFFGFMLIRLFNGFLGLNKEMHFLYYASFVCFFVGLYDDLTKIISKKNRGRTRTSKFILLILLLFPFFLMKTSFDIITSIKYTSIIIFASATADIVDGLDGLLALSVFPSLICLGTDASISLLGSILGFLYYNLRPARIFMGDCGSMFIGSVIGCTILSIDVDYKIGFLFIIPILQILSVGLKILLIKMGLPHSFFIAPIHHDLEKRLGENITTIGITLINAIIVFLVYNRLTI